MPRIIYWVEIVPYWKESLSGIQRLGALTPPWMCLNSEMSALDRQRIQPVYWSLVNEGFIWDAAVFNYMVIYWSETIHVCLRHVKMNSEDKKKVSGILADEGLHLIWVGIQEWRQNTLVLKNRPKVCLQLKFSSKNCQVGFKMREKKYSNTQKIVGIKFLKKIRKYILTVTRICVVNKQIIFC